MKTPFVSVLMPARNAEDTIEVAIESICQQTFSHWELLIVDDGSTDQTKAIIEKQQQKDARICLISQAPLGIVAALNASLKKAKGPFIARMDADDVAYSDRIHKQVDSLTKNPTIGLIGTQVDFGGDRLNNAGYAYYVDWMNELLTYNTIQLNQFIESPFAHPSVMFRKELCEQHGAWKEGNFPEDYELWLRWLASGVVMEKIPLKLLRWNDPPSRLSRTDPRYSFEAFYRIKASYVARWIFQKKGKRAVYLWGAGKISRKRASLLKEYHIDFAGYIDVDPKKIGNIVHGKPVLSATQIPAKKNSFIISYVSKRGAREDIRHELMKEGYQEGEDFILAA